MCGSLLDGEERTIQRQYWLGWGYQMQSEDSTMSSASWVDSGPVASNDIVKIQACVAIPLVYPGYPRVMLGVLSQFTHSHSPLHYLHCQTDDDQEQ